MREEYTKYFEALETHPRLLVGREVPKIGGRDGEMERLRDSTDAKEWQDAIKSLLVEEVKDRAVRRAEDDRGSMETLHASVELFQNNHDLIPGTKQFDSQLATRFVALAKPYEHRVDGKLRGYSIPVQPLVNQLRSEIAAERARAATPAAPATNAPAAGPAPVSAIPSAAPAASAPVAVDPPQAGIPSKAGAGAEGKEDFSTLFGTIGLSGFQI